MLIIPYTIDAAEQIAGLFQGRYPIPTRLWAILDGDIRGRILVDDACRPSIAVIQDLTESTLYFGGRYTAQSIGQAFAIMRACTDPVICLRAEDPLIALLPGNCTYDGVAIDFSERSPEVDLDRLAAIPAGFEVQRIDETLAQRLDGFDYYVTMYGSVQRAVQNTIGYVLTQGETIVGEAVAGPITRGMAELGVETAEAFRRRGLATAVSAYVIRECEALGYRAFWNAAQQNTASVALARRLGFQREEPCRVLAWFGLSGE